jgi:osmotically inducible protein OsmC
MKIQRKGSAQWSGGIKDGKGSISTESGALKSYPYGFASRFEGKPGSNPEELLGAAHAACFTMALSLILGEAKLTATQMDTTARVTLEQVEGGWAINAVQTDASREGARRRRRHLCRAGRQGEGRLPGVEGAQRHHHA